MDKVIEHIRRDDINDNDERLGVKVSIFQEIEPSASKYKTHTLVKFLQRLKRAFDTKRL